MLDGLLKKLEEMTKETLEFFRPKDPFSWQTFFLLGLFSWGMALLSLEDSELRADMVMPPATWVLFTMGWIFITFAVGWGMVKQEVKVPFLDIKVKPAIWVTSGLTSAFAFQVWNPSTRAIAFVSWPIIFALFSALPRFAVISENKYNVPNPAARQEIVLTTLICLLISSWLRVHFVVQDWVINRYPTLVAGNFSESLFVVQLGAPPPIVGIAEQTVNEILSSRPIPEVRGWLVRATDQLPALNEAFREQLANQNIDPEWELHIAPEKIYDPVLRLQVFPLVSALEAENEALPRNAEEREELEPDGPVSPAERIQPKPARFGLERRCEVLSREEYEERQALDENRASPDERENGTTDDSEATGNSSENPSEAPSNDSSLHLGGIQFVAGLVSISPFSTHDPSTDIGGLSTSISNVETSPTSNVQPPPNAEPTPIPNGMSEDGGNSEDEADRNFPIAPAEPSSSFLSRLMCDRNMQLISRRGS